MTKEMLLSVGFPLLCAGLLALVLHGCGSDALNRQPCAEDLPCLEPAVNACPNVTSDQWTSLGLENEDVTAIAVHPCNPGIIYAGTSRNFSSGVQGKLFKSTDCGQSWDTLAVGGSYRTIRFSPGNPEIIYAVNGSILKSSDGGQTWRSANEGFGLDAETGVSTLVVNPKNACGLFAGTSGFYGGGLYRSDDAGDSWQLIEGKGLKENRLANGVTSLAIAPNDPDHVFAGTTWAGDVLRSTDGGKTWESTELKDTGSLVHALTVDPENRRTIYAGLNREGLHVSRNSGRSWEHVTNDFLADATSVVELEMDSQYKVLYVVTTYEDTGRLLSHNLSSGVWKELPVPIANKSFYYSKLKVHEFEGKVYTYFGLPSGIYARIEE